MACWMAMPAVDSATPLAIAVTTLMDKEWIIMIMKKREMKKKIIK